MNVNYIELIKIINKDDPVAKKIKNFIKIWSVRVNVSKSTGLRHYILQDIGQIIRLYFTTLQVLHLSKER